MGPSWSLGGPLGAISEDVHQTRGGGGTIFVSSLSGPGNRRLIFLEALLGALGVIFRASHR